MYLSRVTNPYAPAYDYDAHHEAEGRRNVLALAGAPATGLTLAVGGSFALAGNPILAVIMVALLGALAFMLYRTHRTVARWAAIEAKREFKAYNLHELSRELLSMPVPQREVYRGLWDAAVEADRNSHEYNGEGVKFIREATRTVNKGRKNQARLDALVTADPLTALEVVPEKYRVSSEAMAQLEAAARHAQAVGEVVEEFEARKNG